MTEKRQKKADFKSIEQGHTEGTFSLPFKIPTLCLVGSKPQTPKSKSKGKNGTRFARVFSKAKAHDSKNHLAANIFKSGFSEGGIIELSLCRS